VLAHIIHQRMDEIFNLVLTEIERAGFAQRLNGGVVITGGAAAMQGVAELAADVFGTGVRIGSPEENIGGLADSVDAPRFATVVGLALYGANRSAAGFSPTGRHRALAGAGVDKFTKRLKSWLEDFF
jgi:cell division protein FtsA